MKSQMGMAREFNKGWGFVAALLVCSFGSISGAARQPTTVPSSYVVKMSDAVELSKIQTGDRETNLTDKLSSPQVTETTYFGEVDEYGEDDQKPVAVLPIIALRSGDHWRALPLMGEGLGDAGWKYVAAGPAPKEIWGALDTSAGATRSVFVLAHSIDGGATFEMTLFRKPCRLAQFFDFAMSRNGRGRASVSLAADCGPHKAGVYHFETSDDGKTWSSEPRYEPDVMIRADEVPDEEQPAETAGGAKMFFRSRMGNGVSSGTWFGTSRRGFGVLKHALHFDGRGFGDGAR